MPCVPSPSSGEAEELQGRMRTLLSLIRKIYVVGRNQKEIGPAEVAHALSDSPGKPLSPSDFCASLSHRGSGVTWRSPEFPCQALFGFVLFCFKEQKL